MMRRAAAVFAMCAMVLLLAAAPAFGWFDDGFDQDASGQGVYEDMMIHPQAVRGADGRTYVAYQGPNLDPYVMALNLDGSWDGPVRIAANPLSGNSRIDDTHGAPSLLVDQQGYLHVYWGSHLSTQMHARSSAPLEVGSWELSQVVPPHAMTYPQPALDSSGNARLFYRLDQRWSGFNQYSFMRASFASGAAQFATATAVLSAEGDTRWYAHAEPGAGKRTHLVTVANVLTPDTDPYSRYGVYYLYEDGDGVWRDVRGVPVASPDTSRGATYADITSDAVACTVFPPGEEHQNQVTCADDGSGNAGIIFVTGSGWGPDSHRWVYARWAGSSWVTSTIAPTDHLFDSGTLEFSDGGIDAFLTVGGSSGRSQNAASYEDRGGDIVWFRSEDDGATWSREATIAAADTARGVRYNDPQVVLGHEPGGPRLLFGEWNNDGGNFVHRVFLWGKDGYRQREFFPSIVRAGGANRYVVAAEISKQSFPLGSHTAFVVSGATYADALSAVPLADAMNAPILLTGGTGLSTWTADEIIRLGCTDVVVIGGAGSVGSAVSYALRRTGSVRSVRRIGGRDRYEVASNVASELAQVRGESKTAFVVNGEAWADALSLAPVAARHGSPILLVKQSQVPPATQRALRGFSATPTVVIAGGPASVGTSVATYLGANARLGGDTRYDVSSAVARFALDGTLTVAPCASMGRFTLASGEVFADALPAGVLTSRGRGPLLLTRPDTLPPATRHLLEERAYRVYRATIAGGEATVPRWIADELAELLAERQGN